VGKLTFFLENLFEKKYAKSKSKCTFTLVQILLTTCLLPLGFIFSNHQHDQSTL